MNAKENLVFLFLLIQKNWNIFYHLSHKWPPVDLSSCWKPHFYFCSCAIVCFCHETGDRKELAAQVSRCQWAPGSNYLPASSCLLTQVHAGHMHTINQVCWADVHNNQVHAGRMYTITRQMSTNAIWCWALMSREPFYTWVDWSHKNHFVAFVNMQIYIVQCNGHWYAETWASFCF